MPTAPLLNTRTHGPRNWIAVASAEHVRIGRAEGIMQVCHGKLAPLRRLQPGDRVVYYSPCQTFRGKDKLQAFTAAGIVGERAAYAFDMGGGLRPYRRDVRWFDTRDAPIRELLSELEFAREGPHWGARMRFGLFTVSANDMQRVWAAMGLDRDAERVGPVTVAEGRSGRSGAPLTSAARRCLTAPDSLRFRD